MPAQSAPAFPTDDLLWVELADFSSGIMSQTRQAYSGGAGSYPLGSAQPVNTYRCIALPRGGLAPLPRRVASWAVPAITADPITMGPYVVGALTFGPVNVAPASAYPDEALIGIEYCTNPGGVDARHFKLFRLQLFAPIYATDLLATINPATATPVHEGWGMTMGVTRMDTVAPYTAPGQVVVVAEWSEVGPGASKNTWVFPDPAAPGVTAVSTLLGARAGQLLTHQGRVLLLENLNFLHGGGGGQIPSNEQMSFTDPPNSNTSILAQAQVYVQEWPNGYGAWGSVNAGELFLVKHQGGGVILSGDVSNPTVIRLPGVVSTGGFMCKAAATPVGLFYIVQQGGLHVWNGSNSSSFVSDALDDVALVPAGTVPFVNVRAGLADWFDWVLLPNNYVYDTVNGGFWLIEDPASLLIWSWSRGSLAGLTSYVHGAIATVPKAGGPVLYTWDRSLPSKSFSWQSHPIPKTVNRSVDIREVVVRAQGQGNVTITCSGYAGGSSGAIVFPFNATARPQVLRQKVAIQGSDVTIRIESDGGNNAAPIVYSVAIGFTTTNLQPEYTAA